MASFTIRPGHLSLADIENIYQRTPQLVLDSDCHAGIEASQQTVQKIVSEEQTVYGINTGFGLLAQKRIPADALSQLQVNLILSHAAGTGKMLEPEIVRLALLLKINSLARGHSGVRPVVIDYLIQCFNHDILPQIPEQGSVGASGDLAPLHT